MTFEEAYAQLNTEQKQAVDTIDGPLLVIAGPGTGKTQLLSARAANILKKTDTNAENILCLTFTDKAATNMRSRLLELIGPEAAKIAVHTFHSLGAEIIHKYPDYFWNAARLEPAPEAVKLEIIESILANLPLANPLALKFDGHYTQIQDVTKAIQRAKEAGLTPDKLRAVVTSNLTYLETIRPIIQPLLAQTLTKRIAEDLSVAVASLPNEDTTHLMAPIPPLSQVFKTAFGRAYELFSETGKTTPLSAWKANISESRGGRRVFKDETRNQWWLELANIYERYQQMMNHRRYFDFADMILETIVQLESHETLLTDVQESYHYLMIDEFQDTNDAQFRMAYLIANHPAAGRHPNIMAVGDDDQAIYRFQGAALNNATTFINSFSDVARIILQKNYRSHQSIVDQAHEVAEQIGYRLVHEMDSVEKNITAASKVEKGNIEHILYPSKPHELAGISKLIASQFDLEKGDVAVLARQHESLQQLAAELHRRGVPIRYERAGNIFEYEAVEQILDILALLEYIQTGQREAVDHLLARILAHPMWQLGALQLWRFASAQRGGGDWLEGLLQHTNRRLQDVGTWLTALSSLASHENLTVVMEHVMGLREIDGRRSPFKAFYLESDTVSDSYTRALSAIGRLRSLADEFALERRATLPAFNQFIQLNREHGIVVTDESVFVTGKRAVNLMTVHKAKGLEFDTVFVIDAVDTQWRPRRKGRQPPINLVTLQEYGEENDDYARLMYVAMTRAKRDLIIASYLTGQDGKGVLPSPLTHSIPSQRVEIKDDPVVAAETLESAFRWPQLDHDKARLALASILEDYELAVTHLINFLDLTSGGPQYFLERNLLHLPEVKKPRLAFGSAIHAALREAQMLVNAGKLQLEAVVQTFESNMHNHQLENAQEERYLLHGQELLRRLLSWDAFELPKGSTPEKEIHGVMLGDARLQGSLDRIDTLGNEVGVVDYKTGAALRGKLTSATKNEGVKAWKHRTQLIFYALLLRESGNVKKSQPITGSMIYLETEDARQLIRIYQPTDNDLEHMRRLVIAVWRCIQTLELPDTTSYTKDLAGIQQFEGDLIGTSSE